MDSELLETAREHVRQNEAKYVEMGEAGIPDDSTGD